MSLYHSVSRMILIGLCLGLALTVNVASSLSSETNNIRWAASGGGWRAMTANMAFAKVFAEAGLIGDDATAFSAISTNSGSSWMSAQFFYSTPFFDAVTSQSASELGDLVNEWMSAYQQLILDVEHSNVTCRSRILPPAECQFATYFIYDWARFVAAMLNVTSSVYADPDFASRSATAENRVLSLQNTDWLVQMSLAPASRVRGGDPTNNPNPGFVPPNMLVALGTRATDGSSAGVILTVPISTQYRVSSDTTDLAYALPADVNASQISVFTSDAPAYFSFDDWESYYFYPADDGSSVISPFGNLESYKSDLLSPFFGGSAPAIYTLAAASSARAVQSGLVPSVFSQAYSLPRYEVLTEAENNSTMNVTQALSKLEAQANLHYRDGTLDNFAVCSQYPTIRCGMNDARLFDGEHTDDGTLAGNIAHYQQSNMDTNEPIKIILAYSNHYSDSGNNLLGYFRTTFNQDVDPGAFIWLPNEPLPKQSIQIFEEYMDMATFQNMSLSVPGISNFTTTRLQLTTIDNSVFGVRGGYPVDLLVLSLNSGIDTDLTTSESIERWTPALVRMATTIANNSVLVDRVQAFYGNQESGTNMTDTSPSSAPSKQDGPIAGGEKTMSPSTFLPPAKEPSSDNNTIPTNSSVANQTTTNSSLSDSTNTALATEGGRTTSACFSCIKATKVLAFVAAISVVLLF